MNYLTTSEAAALLGVSGATVRNWHKAGHIPASGNRPLSFTRSDVLTLKERIQNNRFTRLRKRANKSASNKIEAPEIRDSGVVSDLFRIGKTITQEHLNPANFLYLAAVRLLEAEDEAILPNAAVFKPEEVKWRRQPVAEVMRNWGSRLTEPVRRLPGSLDYFLARQDLEDRLGLLYQGLVSVGRKSRTGAYFTPSQVIDDSLSDLGFTPESFLDPCCGTGRYLLHAAAKFSMNPARLHGYDSDPTAVDIAKINLLLHYRDLLFVPKVYCLDSLSDLANGQPECRSNHLLGSIDAIATNPPWGGCKNQARNKNLVELIKSGESFSLFLEKSLRLLRDEGRLSFLLPESILKIRTHTDIRRLILEIASIRKISLLGRVFSGVFTPIMRLDLEKKPAPKDWCVTIVRKNSIHHARQSRFTANAGMAFDVTVTPRDEYLLDKIYRTEHQTLAGKAEWALGIVTGDNSRCVLSAAMPGTEPVLRGRDVFKFAPRSARCHIRFQPERFQQVAPERLYRAPEKLIYRFISDKLIFAYDDSGLLTLNSANILIPRLPGMSIKASLAFLNSRVFQYIFVKRFRTRKILRSDLETMPFPHLSSDMLQTLERQVDKCMSGDYKPAIELDRLVFQTFSLYEKDIAAMEEGIAAEVETLIY